MSSLCDAAAASLARDKQLPAVTTNEQVDDEQVVLLLLLGARVLLQDDIGRLALCTNPYVTQQLASQKVLGGSHLRWGRCLVRERL